MKRRTVLTSVSTLTIAAIAGCSGVGGDSNATSAPTPQGETPSEKEQEALREFKFAMQDRGVRGTELLVSPDGERVVVKVPPNDSIKTAIEEIALAYAETIEQHSELGDTTVKSSNIRGYISRDAAEAYNAGDLKRDAYLETVEMVDSSNQSAPTPTDEDE